MKTNSARNWEKKAFAVISDSDGAASEVEGGSLRMMSSKSVPSGNEISMAVHAFLVPPLQVPWAGSLQDFYLHNRQTVTGIRLDHAGGIIFSPSMINKSDQSIDTLDSLKLYIENHFDYGSVVRHYMGIVKTESERPHSAVDFRTVFRKHLLYTPSSAGMKLEDRARIVSYKVADGVLEISMTSYAGREKGTAWIRIADRKLLRAVENNVQVYPLEIK